MKGCTSTQLKLQCREYLKIINNNKEETFIRNRDNNRERVFLLSDKVINEVSWHNIIGKIFKNKIIINNDQNIVFIKAIFLSE